MLKPTQPIAALMLLFALPSAAQDGTSVNVAVWLADAKQGGWGGNHNSTIARDPGGLILKAGDESYYGSAFRGLGTIDIDKYPYFVVEVDKATGSFGCKLINAAKRDKQVIFRPTPGDRCFLTHLPSQTGWSGEIPLNIGIYCHGENTSLRVKSIHFLPKLTKEFLDKYEQMRNLLFNSSFELDKPGEPPIQTWHRLGDYMPYETPWRTVRQNAFHGKQCAATARPGKLISQREIHVPAARVHCFSLHMKAAKPRHKAKLSITIYRQGRPFKTDIESKAVEVGTEWARYHMTIDVPVVRNRGLLGPTDLTIESLDEGELLADALQFEVAKEPTMYGPNRSLLSYKRATGLRSPLYRPVAEPPAPASMPKREPFTIPLSPLDGEQPPATGWPMVGTITLPQGKTYDISTWRMKNASGECLPTQTRVLARWKGDGSIKAGQAIGQSDGSAAWTLECNSNAPAPEVRQRKRVHRLASMGRGFYVASLDGRRFWNEDKPRQTAVEAGGPIQAAFRVEGAHQTDAGEQLLSYVLRGHAYSGCSLMRYEYTWINTNASPSAAVAAIATRLPLRLDRGTRVAFMGAGGAVHEVDASAGASIVQRNEKRKYSYEVRTGESEPKRFDGKAAGRVRIDLGGQVLDLLVQDWWQNHPMEIAVDREGVTVYFWSPRVKAVELTRGMAKTCIFDVWLGATADAPQRMAGPTTLVPPTAVHCRSGVFGGAILPSEGSPFPIFEKAVNSRACRARMDPDVMLATDSYGQFNYGDCMGDGGWGNLETQRGHSAWIHYLRTGDPRMFHVAQAAARHYRDIDIDQFSGATYTHNPSHTLGGKSTSHSWIQSMLDHYLTTGERRSMEVAQLHADHLKTLPMEKLVRGGRTVTRILDNMADLYMLTGDDELVTRYHEIVAAQKKNLVEGKAAFPGVFQSERYGKWSYPANFVPWYGLYSQAKMRLATGDAAWEAALKQEIGYAMHPRVFRASRPEFFADNDLTDDQRIVRCLAEGAIGDRGCMLFPALAYAYRWTGDKRYLEIGMLTTSIAIISREFQDPLYGLAGVFLEQAREAGLGEEDEKRCYQEAIDIMKRAARPRLSNPGFEEGVEDWKAWSVKATTSSFWVPVRKKVLVPDTKVKKQGTQSLRIVVRRKCPPWGSGVPLDSEFFVFDKGKAVTFTGWVRTTEKLTASAALSLRPLAPDAEPQSFRATFADPGPDGWRRWTLEAEADVDCLARLRLNIGRRNAKDEGDAWWDGIVVSRP